MYYSDLTLRFKCPLTLTYTRAIVRSVAEAFDIIDARNINSYVIRRGSRIVHSNI